MLSLSGVFIRFVFSYFRAFVIKGDALGDPRLDPRAGLA